MIPNSHQYYVNNFNGNGGVYGSWAARYPSDLGNSLIVSICPSAQAFSSNLTSLYNVTANANIGATTIQCSSTVTANITVGDQVQIGTSPTTSGWVSVTGINGANINISSSAVTANGTGLSLIRR